jgi:hypothetical protein
MEVQMTEEEKLRRLLKFAGKLSIAVRLYLNQPVSNSMAAIEHMEDCLEQYDNAINDDLMGREVDD